MDVPRSGYDEWFDEEDPEGKGDVQDELWEETGAATALNRLDPWRGYILPRSAGSRLPPWDLVPGYGWKLVLQHEVDQVRQDLQAAYEEDHKKMCPQGVRNPDTLPPYRADDPWYMLVPLPKGRLFRHVSAHQPSLGNTPKIELVSGDMNSLLYGRPGVRLLFELELRKFSMAMLLELQQEMRPLRPPKEFWTRPCCRRRRRTGMT